MGSKPKIISISTQDLIISIQDTGKVWKFLFSCIEGWEDEETLL